MGLRLMGGSIRPNFPIQRRLFALTRGLSRKALRGTLLAIAKRLQLTVMDYMQPVVEVVALGRPHHRDLGFRNLFMSRLRFLFVRRQPSALCFIMGSGFQTILSIFFVHYFCIIR